MSANDPFARLPEAASFTVTSTTVTDGAAWSPEQFSGIFGVPGGKDLSPQLSWSGAPAGHEELCRHRLRPRRPHRIRVLALGSRRHSRHRHRTARRRRRRHRLGPARGRLPAAQRHPRRSVHRCRAPGGARPPPLCRRGARPRCRVHRHIGRRHPCRPRLHHGRPHPRPRGSDRHGRNRCLTTSVSALIGTAWFVPRRERGRPR